MKDIFMRLRSILCCAVLAFGLTSCGGGSGDVIPTLANGVFGVLDLNTGSWKGNLGTVNPTDPVYRSSKMLFVLVPGGSFRPGEHEGALGKQSDETLGAMVVVPAQYMGVFEVTRAQWQYITNGASSPWLNLPSVAATGGASSNDSLPATGISKTTFDYDFWAFNNFKTHAVLVIPTANAWEYACHGASGTSFSWGNAIDDATVAKYAVLQSSQPAAVGGRLPNAQFLYDMHGNAREWVNNGGTYELRGGGWTDHVLRARAANHIDTVDEDTAHPLSGLRLVANPL